MTDHRDILDRLRDAEGVHGPTGIGELFRDASAAIEQRDQTIANLLDEKRRAMEAGLERQAEIERLCGLLGIKQARTPGGFYPIEEAPQPERWEIRRDAVDIVEGAWVPVEGEPLGITHGYYRMPMGWFRRRVTP
jgi:hypothetical protein